jgi:hypothetical protein
MRRRRKEDMKVQENIKGWRKERARRKAIQNKLR